MNIEDLSKEFPRDRIHWRAQIVRNGTGMALAYLDARDVMERLDEACGPGGWQCEHFPAGENRLGCKIGIKFGDEWIWKSDGAGETQFEAEKGAFSGALKRAAVLWGVGRYLYDMPAPWVPCEERNGKFSKWTADPWEFVKTKEIPIMGKYTKTALEKELRKFCHELPNVSDDGELAGLKDAYKDALEQCEREHPAWWHTPFGADRLGIMDRIKAQEATIENNVQNPLAAG